MGYSPWGCKQLDTTERLTHNTHRVKQIKPKNSRKKIFKIAVAMDEIKKKKKKQTLEKMDRVRRLFEKVSIIDKLLDKLMN